MLDGIAKHWWAVWAMFVVVAIVAMRMRRRGGDEFLPRRILFALFPHADPRNARREVTPRMVLAFIGLVAAVAVAFATTFMLRP